MNNDDHECLKIYRFLPSYNVLKIVCPSSYKMHKADIIQEMLLTLCDKANSSS